MPANQPTPDNPRPPDHGSACCAIKVSRRERNALNLAIGVLEEHAEDSDDPLAMKDAAALTEMVVELWDVCIEDGSLSPLTQERVVQALSTAVEDIRRAAQLREAGTLDALNLLVSAAQMRLAEPDLPLEEVAERAYNETLTNVLDWINDG